MAVLYSLNRFWDLVIRDRMNKNSSAYITVFGYITAVFGVFLFTFFLVVQLRMDSSNQ